MKKTILLALLIPALTFADRARDLGVPFDGTPGPLNAITDVPGVTVGHSTMIEDFPDGRAARTGVTAVLPRGEDSISLPVFAGPAVLNGAGEMAGTIWMEASGILEGPVMRTMTGVHGNTIEAIDHEQLRDALRKFNRLIED